MNYDQNPFQELYLSEGMESEFVDLFSPVPLEAVINPLFHDGNFVLTGAQGCGKTMILQLLLPDTRVAYHRAKTRLGEDAFPIKNPKLRRFISAGVNLTKSGLCDIAGVTLGKGEDHDLSNLPYYFADFLNFWVVRDLLRTVQTVSDNAEAFEGICRLSEKKLSALTECLVSQDCWNGSLQGCATLKDVGDRIAARVGIYRRWSSKNSLDGASRAELEQRKTTIGEPIARTADCLRTAGIIDDDVRVFIRLDQLEELHLAALPRQRALRLGFRHLINRAIASRDRRVHYRIGTRRFGWNVPELLVVHGSGAKLEARRDYILVDLFDQLLSRRENVGGETFKAFADDAFVRRVALAYTDRTLMQQSTMARRCFGKSPTRTELGKQVAQSRSRNARLDRDLGLDDPGEPERWSPEWRSWLAMLYLEDPLSAVLAAAWGRQTGGGKRKRERRDSPPPQAGEVWLKPWWRKERLDQAVLQLAARRAQRMLWWGYADVIDLSGYNITAFLHICHKVWDLLLKTESRKGSATPRIDPIHGEDPIPPAIQSAGIDRASGDWNEKIGEQPGGDLRRRFVEVLGKLLRKQLRDDRKMSYPGANGFSLEDDALIAGQPEFWRFLRDAVGYGDLHAIGHTTKNSAGEKRTKFYLNPILSPAYQIHTAHTKEPRYWPLDRVLELARDAKLPPTLTTSRVAMIEPAPPEDPCQLKLFGE